MERKGALRGRRVRAFVAFDVRDVEGGDLLLEQLGVVGDQLTHAAVFHDVRDLRRLELRIDVHVDAARVSDGDHREDRFPALLEVDPDAIAAAEAAVLERSREP